MRIGNPMNSAARKMTDLMVSLMSCHLKSHAAVDDDLGPDDEGGGAGTQVEHGPGDLFRLGEAFHRNLTLDPILGFLQLFLRHPGAAEKRAFHGSRADRVHADPPVD